MSRVARRIGRYELGLINKISQPLWRGLWANCCIEQSQISRRTTLSVGFLFTAPISSIPSASAGSRRGKYQPVRKLSNKPSFRASRARTFPLPMSAGNAEIRWNEKSVKLAFSRSIFSLISHYCVYYAKRGKYAAKIHI